MYDTHPAATAAKSTTPPQQRQPPRAPPSSQAHGAAAETTGGRRPGPARGLRPAARPARRPRRPGLDAGVRRRRGREGEGAAAAVAERPHRRRAVRRARHAPRPVGGGLRAVGLQGLLPVGVWQGGEAVRGAVGRAKRREAAIEGVEGDGAEEGGDLVEAGGVAEVVVPVLPSVSGDLYTCTNVGRTRTRSRWWRSSCRSRASRARRRTART